MVIWHKKTGQSIKSKVEEKIVFIEKEKGFYNYV